MTNSQRSLGFGAICSFAAALLHVACLFGDESTARFFGAPRYVLVLFKEHNPLIYPIVVVIVAVLGAFGLYAWSAAGFMRRLPWLRTGVLTVGIIYLLRGLLLVPQVIAAVQHPGRLAPQFLAFSAGSLVFGVAILAGTIGRWAELSGLSVAPERHEPVGVLR